MCLYKEELSVMPLIFSIYPMHVLFGRLKSRPLERIHNRLTFMEAALYLTLSPQFGSHILLRHTLPMGGAPIKISCPLLNALGYGAKKQHVSRVKKQLALWKAIGPLGRKSLDQNT